MYEIEFCYSAGNLDKALLQASQFVNKIGEEQVQTITTNHDVDAGWTVIVVYESNKQ